MITTAVQHASQMVEIQGAPVPVPATGEEFRATFAASVNAPAAQKPAASGAAAAQTGVASAKHVVLAGLVAKTPSLAASGALQGVLEPESDGLEGNAEAASLANGKAASEGPLQSAAADDLAADASSAQADAGLASEALAGAAVALKTQGAASANSQATASGLAVSAGVAKDVAAQPTESAAARGRKEQTTVSAAGEIVSGATSAVGGSLQIAALAVPLAQLDTTTVVQAVQTRTADGGSIAASGTKPGVLTGVLQASDGASGFHGSPVRPISGGYVPDAAPTFHPELNEVASLQQGTFAAAVATTVSESSGKTVSSATVASAKGGPQSASIAVEVQTAASEGGSATAGSTAAAASVVIEANLKPVAGAAQTKSVSAGNSIGVKASASVEVTEAVAVTQARTIAQPHPVSGAQQRIASQAAVSKTSGTVTAQLAASEGKNSASSAVPASAVAAAIGGPAITAQAEVKLEQQPDAVRDVAAGAVPLAEASSRAAIVAAKDEKTKSVSASSDDRSSSQLAAQSFTGDTSNAAATATANVTASFATAENAAGRVVPVADAVIPVTLAAAHIAAVPVHDAAAAVGSAASGRALGAVSAGAVAETGSAAAPIGEPHRTLLATPTTLEVGVQSGTQGWLRIRAEVGGPGEVNASLTAASSGAREALHSQLPALNAFLHSEQIAATATVADRGAGFAGGGHGDAAFGSGGLGSGGLGGDGSNGSNASLLQGGGAQSGGGQREAAQPAASVSDAVRSYDSLGGVSDAAGPLSGSASLSEESGRWLNVRA